MKQTFSLKNGEIIFENDKILISDKAKLQKYFLLALFGLWTLKAIKDILEMTQPIKNSIDIYWEIFAVSIGLILFVTTLFRSTKNSIELHDIKSIKLKKRLNNYFLKIRLKDNRFRFVGEIEEPDEINEFITKYIDNEITK
jgi:hypothetical protein